MKIRFDAILKAFAAVGFAIALAFAVYAADLTVPYGITETVTVDATYDTVTVNGNLVVAEGVTLTATQFDIGTGSDFSKRASLTLKNGAKFRQPSFASETYHCNIGKTSPADITILTNAVFSTTEFVCGGNQEASISGKTESLVHIVLENGKLESAKSFDIRVKDCDKSSLACTIELKGESSEIDVLNVTVYRGSLCVKFCGGRFLFDNKFNYGNSQLIRNQPWSTGISQTIFLESVDGADIRFFCTSGIEGNRKKDFGLIDNTKNDSTAAIVTTGTGAFAMEGTAEIPVFPTNTTDYGSISFGHTGGFRVPGQAKFVSSAKTAAAINAMASAPKLLLAADASLDLRGANVTFGVVDSAGSISDSVSGSGATLTVGAGGGDVMFGRAPSVPVVKQGSGVLRIPEGELSAVDVQGGTLDFCDRAAVGFPWYRFWVRHPRGAHINLSEFALFEEGVEVSGNHTGISYPAGGYVYNNYGKSDGGPTNLFDRIPETTWNDLRLNNNSSWYEADGKTNLVNFIVHFGGAKSFPGNYYDAGGNLLITQVNAFEASTNTPASDSPCQRVTAYTFAYGDAQSHVPQEWYFQGAAEEDKWQNLDHVTAFSNSGFSSGSWCGTNFVVKCGISAVSVDNLSVGNNVAWTIDMDQADITIGTLTAGRKVHISVMNEPDGNIPPALPVTIGNISGSVDSWRLTYSRAPGTPRSVAIENGVLKVLPMGFFVIIR